MLRGSRNHRAWSVVANSSTASVVSDCGGEFFEISAFFGFTMDKLILVISVILMAASSQGTKEQQIAGRLIKTIRDQVEYQTRPKSVTVSVKFNLLSLNEVNPGENYIDLDGWLGMTWKDDRMAAFFRDRGTDHNVKSIVVPHDTKLWKPDIQLYNDHSGKTTFTQSDMVVLDTGDIIWWPPVHIVARCEMTTEDFPYDRHICKPKFGSWVYNAKQVKLNLTDSGLDYSTFSPNPRWEIEEMSSKVGNKTYDCCPEAYEHIIFSFKIARRGAAAMMGSFVAPAVLIAILVPFQFLIHPDAKERMTYCIALLLAAAIFLFGLEKSITTNFATMPNIMKHFMVTVGVVVVSMLKSVFHLLMYNRGGRHGKLPGCLKSIALTGLNALCCVDRYERPQSGGKSDDKGKLEGVTSNHLESQVDEVIDILKRREAKDEEESNAEDWRQFVMVIDRVSFVIFFIIFIIYTVYLLV